MFEDHSFFGLARTGILEDGSKYPLMLNSKAGQISKKDGILRILSDEIDLERLRKAAVPDGMNNGIETDNFVVLTMGLPYLSRPSKFFRYLNNIQSVNGYRKLLYLPGVSDPYLLPVLVYLGISIFDDIQLRTDSRNGILYSTIGYAKSNENCEGRNREIVNTELDILSHSIREMTLRNIVESSVLSATAIALLRHADRLMNGSAENIYPVRTGRINAYSQQSLLRPDIVRYRRYISEEYTTPRPGSLLLLIPCSARKPYSTSRSHRKIIEAIAPYRKFLHEVILTSPLGLVPRELEDLYPASFYDVPVTGDWSVDEKKMMNDLIISFLKRNEYSEVLAFVPEEYSFISETVEEKSIMIGRYDRDQDIQNLRIAVRERIDRSGISPRWKRYSDIVSKIRFQFGSWFPDISDSIRIVRNYNLNQIVLDGKVNFVIVPDLGKLTITKHSAHFFTEAGRNLVEIDDFKPTSNIYAVGVETASQDVAQESEVVVHHSGEVRAVGIAKMPARAMIELSKGVAVKVRN